MLVEIENQRSVRILKMNNRENRFNPEFLESFNQALDRVEDDRSARALVLCGTHEKYFSNGLDIQWIATAGPEKFMPHALAYCRMIHRVFTFPKPTVAAINGHAFAGGMFLAQTTDWRIMRQDRGWCCIPEIDLGFPMPLGHIALLSYSAGSRMAERVCLTGERLSADQALKTGFVDELSSIEDLLTRAVEKARLLGSKKQPDYAKMKQNLRKAAASIMDQDAKGEILNLFK